MWVLDYNLIIISELELFVVVADSRSPRDGRFIEEIGYYDPKSDPAVINIDTAKAEEWIKKGAQPTDTVKRLMKG